MLFTKNFPSNLLILFLIQYFDFSFFLVFLFSLSSPLRIFFAFSSYQYWVPARAPVNGFDLVIPKKLKGLTAQKENTYEIEFNMKLNLSSLLKKRLLINYTRSRPELN